MCVRERERETSKQDDTDKRKKGILRQEYERERKQEGLKEEIRI